MGSQDKKLTKIKKQIVKSQSELNGADDNLYESKENEKDTASSSKMDENYNNNFMAFKISMSSVQYKSVKSIMINFENITDVMAKYRLFSIHSKLICQFVINSQNRMEQLHR
jgi:hypothetical protein